MDKIDSKFLVRQDILGELQDKIVHQFDLRSAPLFHATSSTTIKFLLACGYIPGSTYEREGLISKGDIFVFPSPYFNTARKLGKSFKYFIFGDDFDEIESALRGYAGMSEIFFNLINYLHVDLSNQFLSDLIIEIDNANEFNYIDRKYYLSNGIIELLSYYCNVEAGQIVDYISDSVGNGYILGLDDELLKDTEVTRGDDVYDLRIKLPQNGLTVDYIKWIMPLGERELNLLTKP